MQLCSIPSILQELADWNTKYEQKFGHIFIIFASGKTAPQMLEALKARYSKKFA